MSADEMIDSLAARQLGLVTRAQLTQHGVTVHAIAGRVRARRLHLLHRGVYRVGPLVVAHARELAAVLACGEHAVLSHLSAGWLWQWLPDPGDAVPVEVSVTRGDGGRRKPHIRVHRVRLSEDDVTTLHGIPVTSASRTLIDLAGVLTCSDLERVVAQAERANLLDRRTLQLLAARREGRPGAPKLRLLLEKEAGPALTRSEAEARFLALIRKGQLPAPETNVRVGDYEVDFLWRPQRLVVEVDGFAFHSSPRKFENDRRRDARLAASGVSVMRVTWRQVVLQPEAVLVSLSQTLARTGVDLVNDRRQRREY